VKTWKWKAPHLELNVMRLEVVLDLAEFFLQGFTPGEQISV
jgi:hypothetical protein